MDNHEELNPAATTAGTEPDAAPAKTEAEAASANQQPNTETAKTDSSDAPAKAEPDASTAKSDTETKPNTDTAPSDTCSNCGAVLTEGQEFCPKCGTPRKKKNVCAKCGAELQEGQEFCPKCGQKVGLAVDNHVSSAINQFNAGIDKANAKRQKKPAVIAAATVIIILAVIAFTKLAPKIFVSVEELCEQGEYEKAYKKASGDEKMDVLAENMVAHLSSETSDSLKDPSSFSLRDAWFNCTYESGKVKMQSVLYVSGANSYGAKVSNYWLYVYDQDSSDWELWGTATSLDLDKDDDDYLTSMVAKIVMESTNTEKLAKSSVKNINALFEEDKLDEVDTLDVDELDTKVIPTGSADDDEETTAAVDASAD